LFLSRAAEVALLSLPLLDARGPEGEGRKIHALAQDAGVPAPFLAKVLGTLVEKGLLRSRRGRGGGFLLGRPAAEITVADVVLALSGDETLDEAFPPSPEPLGELLEPCRQKLRRTLSETSVLELGPKRRGQS
jgi:Rrf2 family protein